jgi:hypothetical protein
MVFQEDGENLKGLASKFELHSGFAQFSCPQVNFEVAEPD